MTPHDWLLRWASEQGQGSWHLWCDTCSGLGLEPNSAARTLSDLGHVEFDWEENRFSCAPPCAILLPRASGSALLTGARRSMWYSQLDALAASESHDVYLHPPVEQPNGPATWLLEADLGQIQSFCEEAKVEFQVQSGRDLLHRVGVATLESCGLPEAPPPTLPRFWFDVKARRFRWGEGLFQPGWWKVDEPRRHAYYVRTHDQWYRIPVREYAPYLNPMPLAPVTFNLETMTMAVDQMAPLPPLLARALTLQSGRLPRLNRSGALEYVNVDGPLAGEVGRILCLPSLATLSVSSP